MINVEAPDPLMFTLTFATLILDQFGIGAGAIALGALMAYCGFWYGRRLRLIRDTPLSRFQELREGRAKVKGQVLALTEPLHSPALGKPCVYYKFWVLGNKWALARASTLVLDSDCVPCAVSDGTGAVVLNLAEAELDLAVDRRASSAPLTRGATDLVRLVERRYGVRGRGVSTSYKEAILEQGDTVIVIGQARMTADGRWRFIKEKGEPLIVWDRTEEELASRYGNWVNSCWILAAVALLGGILLIILALLGVDVSNASR